jgi:hypothetical protein
MLLERELETAQRDCLCRCGWPRRYAATVFFLRHGVRAWRLYPLCELHSRAFAVNQSHQELGAGFDLPHFHGIFVSFSPGR